MHLNVKYYAFWKKRGVGIALSSNQDRLNASGIVL